MDASNRNPIMVSLSVAQKVRILAGKKFQDIWKKENWSYIIGADIWHPEVLLVYECTWPEIDSKVITFLVFIFNFI